MSGWRCFHCGDRFTRPDAARDHFGANERAVPACQIKASEGGLVRALRQAEAEVQTAHDCLQAESAEGLKAMRAAQSRHHTAVMSAEQTGYDQGVADCRAQIQRLQRIVHRFGDRISMATCHRSDWQIEIDEAMRFVEGNPELNELPL